jgi:hypothetical protein
MASSCAKGYEGMTLEKRLLSDSLCKRLGEQAGCSKGTSMPPSVTLGPELVERVEVVVVRPGLRDLALTQVVDDDAIKL